ncbi:hypothetical protein PUND_a2227 [Pseudoalteromonas undina]|nr:hypothetical protein PUND_a2227 [Pseudoalteromonas undina]
MWLIQYANYWFPFIESILYKANLKQVTCYTMKEYLQLAGLL